ncbi:hypothetical protein [Elizabethkingia meningoseptica]|uniref:hypothetical protein n=1 Tax=Elizabethkingia meningoseptica TaxID=238 RepID=UPI0038927CED
MMIDTNNIASQIECKFDLKDSLMNYFGEEKAEKILSDIKKTYERIFPLEAVSFKVAARGFGFTDLGTHLMRTDKREEMYTYYIGLTRTIYLDGGYSTQEFSFVFN